MEEEKNNLFREESIERISSPDELNDYIKVANPGVWITLLSILILFAGVIYWCCTAQLQTTVSGMITSEMGITTCYISEENASKVQAGMRVESDGETYVITAVNNQALEATEILSEYQLHVGNFMDGEWIVPIELDRNAPKGVREATIVVESISPLYFIFND